ncbi:MAG: hypothetical protein IPG53_17145 [Ignavibacteriales bacterium]|nr:hypothetical protein [Ignavibacteriales bacterium]
MYNALVKEEPTNMKFGYFLSHAYLHVGELDSAKKVMEKYANNGSDPYYMLGTAAIAFRDKIWR